MNIISHIEIVQDFVWTTKSWNTPLVEVNQAGFVWSVLDICIWGMNLTIPPSNEVVLGEMQRIYHENVEWARLHWYPICPRQTTTSMLDSLHFEVCFMQCRSYLCLGPFILWKRCTFSHKINNHEIKTFCLIY